VARETAETHTLPLPAGASRHKLVAASLVVLSTVSAQLGAAYATRLFLLTPPVTASWIRNVVSAGALLLLLLARRGSLRGIRPGYALALGLVLGLMNTAFYYGIALLPLGDAVAVEFTGPIVIAGILSPRRRDLMWVAMAAAGVIAISKPGPDHLNYVGLAWVLAAGACWAFYVLVGRRVATGGRQADTLAMAMVVAAILLTAPALWQGGGTLTNPVVLLMGVLVGILSSAVPYSVELLAMKRIPSYVFGVLLSLHPLMGALVGAIVLSQAVHPLEAAGFALVVGASVGVTLTSPPAEATAEVPIVT
jgi:inner membrane transporter RhtA